MLPNEPEILEARLPFPSAQEALDGVPKDLHLIHIGWYGSDFHADRGCYAICHQDDTTLVGDRLKISHRGRVVNVYCFGSADIGDYELVLTRRAFAALELLSEDAIDARVETLIG